MVHGGAGALDNVRSDRGRVRYLESIRVTLEYGRAILLDGGAALQAVEACAGMLEDDPLFNAGCGSVLNEDGKVEMDAGIMDGRDLSAGSVAGVHNVANPISLARLVLEQSEHVMLIGAGAMRFAEKYGVERMADPYFLTRERVEQYNRAKMKGRTMLDHDSDVHYPDNKFGTIGAVARDMNGNLAAATSTGGIVYKQFGRVGDSPIIGSGVYADNLTCAISTTGFGEDFMRTVFAKSVADRVEFLDLPIDQIADQAIQYFRQRINGRGGFILIDRDGCCISRFTTQKMIHGWIEKNGEAQCTF